MAQLIINQDATLRNYLEAFHEKFSVPQWKYFVTVLMGLLHCDGSKTLSGMLRQVVVVVTMSGLSRFLISPVWSVAALCIVRRSQSLGHPAARTAAAGLDLFTGPKGYKTQCAQTESPPSLAAGLLQLFY